MLRETATVVACESNAVWVEARQQRQCGSCTAKSACGHHLLHAVFGRRSGQILALSDSADLLASIRPGDRVHIGINESLLLKASLLLYLLPIVCLLAGSLLAAFLLVPEWLIVISGLLGLTVGFVLLRSRRLQAWLPVTVHAALLSRAEAGGDRQPLPLNFVEREV